MTEPVTFYFVRHGESEANAAHRFAGRTDSPLTQRGRQQAKAVAEALANVHFDRIVSSPLSRCRDTALVIARRHQLPLDLEPDLVEIDVGEKTGVPFDEVRGLPEWSDDGFVAWPRGETLDQVLSRAHRVITRIAAESAGQRVLVVGHGGVTRILMSHFLGLLPRLDRSPATNTNVSVVVSDGLTHRVERLFTDARLV
ncbi:MAG TPA: histidine phosphatase family protein [Candidatus Limnocylindria bacterium]|nr:histidine phosphatase family protein [Candidatus Limnocylindria bacterium]